MPLFRKRSQSQAERLASWRSEALRAGRADDGLGPLLEEIGAEASEHRRGWAVELSGGTLFITTIHEGTTLSGWSQIEDSHDAAELAALLQRNLDPRLVWTSLGDDELGARFAVPLDGFDRGAVLLALETMAATLGDEALATRARDAREPARGEAAEQEANARAAGAVTAALDALGLASEADPERSGVWRVTVDRGVIETVLRDTGESLFLMHELEYTGGDDNAEILRWLLQASDWNSARLGLAPLPGGPGLFAACALPALEPQALAWGVEQVLRLAEDYDERAGG